MRFFSYSPNDGFSFHDTKDEAIKEASAALGVQKDKADSGWSEDVCEICWGVVRERATKTNERPAEPGSDFDYLCEYKLEPDPIQELSDQKLNQQLKIRLSEATDLLREARPFIQSPECPNEVFVLLHSIDVFIKANP